MKVIIREHFRLNGKKSKNIRPAANRFTMQRALDWFNAVYFGLVIIAAGHVYIIHLHPLYIRFREPI